jgi:methyl-accepting chemotaxis protein
MKSRNNFIANISICAAVLLIIIANLFIQMNVAKSYPLDETVGSAVNSLIFRGGLLSIILVAGLSLYFLMIIQRLAKKKNRLGEMINKLLKKDFSSEENFSDDPKMQELQQNIISLGAWINQLKANVQSAEQGEKSCALKIQEQNDELHKLHTTISNLKQDISVLEEKISSSAEALNITNNSILSYQKKISELNDAMNTADKNISESSLLIMDLSKKMNESTALSAELEKEMTSGEDQVIEIADMIKGISADLEKIQEITRTINNISEQTNILSMNAAIESAHAGSAGAGFAVVADEIRKLAESTKENSDQINREVNALIEKIKEALKASKDSSVSFNGIAEKIRNFSQNIISINSIASQSMHETENIRIASSYDEPNNTAVKIQTNHSAISDKITKTDYQSLKKKDNLEQKKTSENNSVSFTSSSGISAEARELTDREKLDAPKKEIYTLRSFSENEKNEIEKTRASIEMLEIPENNASSKTFISGTSEESAESDYDERGVAVKRPPTTIF